MEGVVILRELAMTDAGRIADLNAIGDVAHHAVGHLGGALRGKLLNGEGDAKRLRRGDPGVTDRLLLLLLLAFLLALLLEILCGLRNPRLRLVGREGEPVLARGVHLVLEPALARGGVENVHRVELTQTPLEVLVRAVEGGRDLQRVEERVALREREVALDRDLGLPRRGVGHVDDEVGRLGELGIAERLVARERGLDRERTARVDVVLDPAIALVGRDDNGFDSAEALAVDQFADPIGDGEGVDVGRERSDQSLRIERIRPGDDAHDGARHG